MTDMTSAGKHRLQALTGGQRAVAAVIALTALGLAAYAAAASYDTVSGQAASHGVSLPRLNPLGIDGGLFGIIVLDIALTWAGQPIWWLRSAARLFAAGTIAANASAGWPDPAGVGLRIAAPALFVIIVEAARTTLLRQRNAAEREKRTAARKRRLDNRIPAVRWLLDFRGTLALWKRMKLWREPSYARAVTMEISRLAAIERLGMRYGSGWQDKAPADLVWMLATGVQMTEALARVTELCAAEPEPEPVPVPVTAARKPKAVTGSGPAGSRKRKPAVAGRKSPATAGPETPAVNPEDLPDGWDDLDTEARVLALVDKGYSASKAGIAAGVTDARGRQIARLARDLSATAPQDVVSETKGAGGERR